MRKSVELNAGGSISNSKLCQDEEQGVFTFPADDVPGELAHRQLHPQTHTCGSRESLGGLETSTGQRSTARRSSCTQERFLLVPGPVDGVDLPRGSSDSEASRNQDPTEVDEDTARV